MIFMAGYVGGVDLHGKHPRPPPKGASLTNGRILLRPHQHNADDPLAWFVTAVHIAQLSRSNVIFSNNQD